MTGASPSNCFVTYPGHLLGESNPSAEMHLMYSTDLANWTRKIYLGICNLKRYYMYAIIKPLSKQKYLIQG